MDYSYPVKTFLDIYDNAKLYVNGTVSICRGCKVVLYEGTSLSIGGGTYINECTRIHCQNYISIGNRCAIAFEVLMMDSDLHNIITDNKIVNPMSTVIIGDHVWIGARATILKGSEIEDNSIIASSSLVTKKCLSNNIYVGNMLRPITEFDSWE